MTLKGWIAAITLGLLMVQPDLARPGLAAPKTAAKPPVQAHTIPPQKPGLLPDMALGNPKAPITVIEYASASCPHCADWNATEWPQFEDKYVRTGKVRFIFREVLTSPQEYALSAFLLGRCAVNRSGNPSSSAPYFTVLNSFFTGQKGYYQSKIIGRVTADVTAKTGMTQSEIQACIADGPAFSAFMSNLRAHTEADDVHNTPTFFVNGKRIDGHHLSDLEAAIEAAR